MIKRTIFPELFAHLEEKEISMIIGPRQAGKTTLMKLLSESLCEAGKPVLFLNFDIEADRFHLQTQARLLQKIKLECGSEKSYIFLDEIQRKEDAGLFLKGLYDMGLPHKFIVSGSGSVELKEKIHESLAGRKRIFELGTVSFKEFVNFKTDYRYEAKLDDFFAAEAEKTRLFLDEFINYGAYPRVLLVEKAEEKAKIIDEIYRSYLERDIAYLLNVRKTDDFTRLFRLLASQIGNLINISELSSRLGISTPTLNNYLWYLEKTYIITRVNPYFKNIRKEISKTPVYYFNDLGLRAYAAGEFGSLKMRDGQGFVLENFVLNVLSGKKNTGGSVHFWRSKEGAEVDFVINNGQNIIPIEVKKRYLKKAEISRSFRNFILKYSPPKAYLVNLQYQGAKKIEDCEVNFILPHEIISRLGE
jgi:uncharacterized protein